MGRRGLIIETAAGVHPGFKGCLTLELTNVGEVPIALRPAMRICQIFLHDVTKPGEEAKGQFRGLRKPVLGTLEPDDVVRKLATGIAP
jgi:dCTP deaminase